MARRSALLRLLIRLIGPVVLVVVVWRLDDKQALWRSVWNASWPLLAGAVLLNAPIVHLKVVRWRALLAARGFPYSLKRTYAAVLTSLYLGMLTPGRVGDALRIQYVKHEIEVPYAEGLATTLMDRFCDLYVLAGFVALGIVHFASNLQGELVYATWGAVAVAVLAPLLLLLPGPAEIFARVVEKLTSKWRTSVKTLLSSLRALVGRSLLLAVPLTVAAFTVNYAQGWLVARGLGIELSFLDVSSMLATTSLLGLMPISVSGVGVRELFLALVFPALGLVAAQGVAFGLVLFTCNHLAIVLVGFVAWQLSPPPFDVATAQPSADQAVADQAASDQPPAEQE